MSDTPPTAPCYVLFRGIRHASKPGHIEQIHAPVRIEWAWVGARKELAVAMCGRTTRFPLGAFSGEWRNIDELLGKEKG